MRAVPFPALSLGGTTCEALMSALNFICSAREGEEIIADGIAIPRTAEMEASLLMKGPSEICFLPPRVGTIVPRSEEHTSELQSLLRTSYAAFCLKTTNSTQAITP